ncbi:MAG: hypothetical protein EAX96_04735 [Candidatus Lokiarchaeota archaeon]|nr:hypothetical protein [Candidatus Lokiarchaeota archaeon]
MDFIFFSTFYQKINSADIPITVGYESCTPKMIKSINDYKGKNMIHSGNWWNIDPKKRTPEVVLENQEKLFVENRTIGLMSCNVPASFEREDYWNLSPSVRKKSIQTCLDNADWALEHQHKKTQILCSLEVTTYEEAREWFHRALDHGHTYFCRGVAEFLSKPKYRKEGLKKIIEFVIGAQKVLEGRPFHLSGTASLNLIPIFAYLGVTSVDGSTPVRSALGFGTVYLSSGKGVKVSKLPDVPWKCDCQVCSDKNEDQIYNLLKEDSSKRVMHNLEIWKNKVAEITSRSREELKEYIKNLSRLNKNLKNTWNLVQECLKSHNFE